MAFHRKSLNYAISSAFFYLEKFKVKELLPYYYSKIPDMLKHFCIWYSTLCKNRIPHQPQGIKPWPWWGILFFMIKRLSKGLLIATIHLSVITYDLFLFFWFCQDTVIFCFVILQLSMYWVFHIILKILISSLKGQIFLDYFLLLAWHIVTLFVTSLSQLYVTICQILPMTKRHTDIRD